MPGKSPRSGTPPPKSPSASSKVFGTGTNRSNKGGSSPARGGGTPKSSRLKSPKNGGTERSSPRSPAVKTAQFDVDAGEATPGSARTPGGGKLKRNAYETVKDVNGLILRPPGMLEGPAQRRVTMQSLAAASKAQAAGELEAQTALKRSKMTRAMERLAKEVNGGKKLVELNKDSDVTAESRQHNRSLLTKQRRAAMDEDDLDEMQERIEAVMDLKEEIKSGDFQRGSTGVPDVYLDAESVVGPRPEERSWVDEWAALNVDQATIDGLHDEEGQVKPHASQFAEGTAGGLTSMTTEYHEQVEWKVKIGWERAHAIAHTLIACCGTSALARAIEECDDEFAASTHSFLDALYARARQVNMLPSATGDKGAAGVAQAGGSGAILTTAPFAYANLHGKYGLACEEPAWANFLHPEAQVGACFTINEPTSASGSPECITSRTGFAVPVRKPMPNDDDGPGVIVFEPQDSAIVRFVSWPTEKHPTLGGHLGHSLIQTAPSSYDVPPLATIELTGVHEPGMWEAYGVRVHQILYEVEVTYRMPGMKLPSRPTGDDDDDDDESSDESSEWDSEDEGSLATVQSAAELRAAERVNRLREAMQEQEENDSSELDSDEEEELLLAAAAREEAMLAEARTRVLLDEARQAKALQEAEAAAAREREEIRLKELRDEQIMAERQMAAQKEKEEKAYAEKVAKEQEAKEKAARAILDAVENAETLEIAAAKVELVDKGSVAVLDAEAKVVKNEEEDDADVRKRREEAFKERRADAAAAQQAAVEQAAAEKAEIERQIAEAKAAAELRDKEAAHKVAMASAAGQRKIAEGIAAERKAQLKKANEKAALAKKVAARQMSAALEAAAEAAALEIAANLAIAALDAARLAGTDKETLKAIEKEAKEAERVHNKAESLAEAKAAEAAEAAQIEAKAVKKAEKWEHKVDRAEREVTKATALRDDGTTMLAFAAKKAGRAQVMEKAQEMAKAASAKDRLKKAGFKTLLQGGEGGVTGADLFARVAVAARMLAAAQRVAVVKKDEAERAVKKVHRKHVKSSAAMVASAAAAAEMAAAIKAAEKVAAAAAEIADAPDATDEEIASAWKAVSVASAFRDAAEMKAADLKAAAQRAAESELKAAKRADKKQKKAVKAAAEAVAAEKAAASADAASAGMAPVELIAVRFRCPNCDRKLKAQVKADALTLTTICGGCNEPCSKDLSVVGEDDGERKKKKKKKKKRDMDDPTITELW